MKPSAPSPWRRASCLLALAILPPLLPGCGQPAQDQAATGSDQDRSAKLAAYFRSMVAFSPQQMKREFEASNDADPSADDEPFIDASRPELALGEIRRNRAMASDLGEVDAAADRLLPALEKLTARAKMLDSYATRRGYLTDDFATARRERPLLLADYDALIAAYVPFADTVWQARAAADAEMLPRLRAEGRMADYHEVLLRQRAQSLRRVVDAPDALKQPQRVAQADRIIAEMEKLLDPARAARAAEAKKSDDPYAALDNGVVTGAESLIGAYRDLRQGKRETDYERFTLSAESAMTAGM